MSSIISGIGHFLQAILEVIQGAISGVVGILQAAVNSVVWVIRETIQLILGLVSNIAGLLEGVIAFILSNILIIGVLVGVAFAFLVFQGRSGAKKRI